MRGIFRHIKDKYGNPKYPFQDRLYFLFGTAGVLSAAAAFFSAIICGLPAIAAITSLVSFFISSIIMFVSLFIKDISIARIICSVFLNFFMFPVLFWVAGGINSGMIFYFILGLCVATLILNGKTRAIILGLTLSIDIACLFLGFINPEWGYALSYTERQMDTISSFLIVSLFIIAVILILSWEYEKEHEIVMNYNADLKHQVITDNLTTLYNQNFLLYTLDEQIKLCNKTDAVMSVVMFDIDDFKRVNDCFGHLRGNQVLCQFSSILKEAAGTKYTATRYGGEEFFIIMPGAHNVDAFVFAEQVRLLTRNNQVLQALTEGTLTISGGVAEYQNGTKANELIHLVDTRLYIAKGNGKDQICASSEGSFQS